MPEAVLGESPVMFDTKLRFDNLRKMEDDVSFASFALLKIQILVKDLYSCKFGSCLDLIATNLVYSEIAV